MKKLIVIVTVMLAIVFSGFSQNQNLKGPKYKNAKPTIKHKGVSSVLLRDNPTQFQGPVYKNLNPRNYEKEIIDSKDIKMSEPDLIVSTENKIYLTESNESDAEKIIYRRVRTKDMEGKNKKDLKGPAYKNYKP